MRCTLRLPQPAAVAPNRSEKGGARKGDCFPPLISRGGSIATRNGRIENENGRRFRHPQNLILNHNSKSDAHGAHELFGSNGLRE